MTDPAQDAWRRKLSRWLALLFGAMLLALAGFAVWNRRGIGKIARNWDDLSEGSAIARELHHPADFVEYILRHAEDVSLVAYRVGDEAHGIYVNADKPRPLIGASQLLVLSEYHAAVANGALRPDEPVSLSAWETYLLPNTDGGAHATALVRLRSNPDVKGDTFQLQDLVFAMVRFNDHAAADYLLQRLGRARVASVPSALALPNEQAPLPISGILLTWENTRDKSSPSARLERYRALTPAAYADEAWRLSEELRHDPQLRAAEIDRLTQHGGFALTLREQAQLTRALLPRGTARGYAQLSARIAAGELPSSSAIEAELSWPMEQPDIRQHFDRFASKGGSLPGIVTGATYATAHGTDATRVAVLFFEGLPMAVWLELMHNFLHQRFEQALLADDASFEHIRERLRELSER